MRKNNNEANMIQDTSVVTRLEKDLQRDTVIKWHEKIIYKEVKPERIYVQKTDTVFLEKVKKLDVMIDLKKKGRKLNVFTFNQHDTIAKEYEFDNVGNDFTIASKTNGLTLKTKKFYREKVILIADYRLQIADYKKQIINLGIETGWNYLDRFGLSAGVTASYDLKERDVGLWLRIGMKMKLTN